MGIAIANSSSPPNAANTKVPTAKVRQHYPKSHISVSSFHSRATKTSRKVATVEATCPYLDVPTTIEQKWQGQNSTQSKPNLPNSLLIASILPSCQTKISSVLSWMFSRTLHHCGPSSSSLLASVSLWHAHSRAVVLHTVRRVSRNTRLCPLISYRFINVLDTVASSRESSFTSPLLLFSAIPIRHHLCRFPRPRPIQSCLVPPRIPTRSPVEFSDPSHRSNSDRGGMYCATVFWCRWM